MELFRKFLYRLFKPVLVLVFPKLNVLEDVKKREHEKERAQAKWNFIDRLARPFSWHSLRRPQPMYLLWCCVLDLRVRETVHTQVSKCYNLIDGKEGKG